VVLRSTKLLKVTESVFSHYLKSYLKLKQSEKLKFIKYCPFFIWSEELNEDLVSAMSLMEIGKE
jgi:hypothetical protein